MFFHNWHLKRRPIYILAWITSIFWLLSSQIILAQDEMPVIHVDTTQELNVISPFVYGLNHSPGGISLDMQEEAQAININFLRFPHGNWGDLNNLTPFHIDLFIAEAQLWNSTPSINVRLQGGTPEQAAELVRYTNIEKNYTIRYWYIGNEPNLYEDYSVEQYVEEWRSFALAMREVDPTIVLIGPELSQFPDTFSENDYYYELKHTWLREFLIHNGDLVDIVSVHRYPYPIGNNSATIEQLRENVPNWRILAQNIREITDEVIGDDILIGITEANSHWNQSAMGEATPDSHYNAIWWSGVLTTLIHEEVDIVSYFMLYSPASNTVYGILDRYAPRPTYYTYALYSELGNIRLVSESSDPYITALATQREDNTTALLLTNLYDEDKSVVLDLNLEDMPTIRETQLFSPEIQAEPINVDQYLADDVLTLPKQSIMLLIFDAN